MSESSENEDLELNEEQSTDDEEIASGEEAVENDAEEETDDDLHTDDEKSGVEEPDINASATESDEDDSDEVDDDEDIPPTKKILKTQPSKIFAKITDAVKERHEKRKGRQLFIRFPEKLPESIEDFNQKIKSLSELIVEGHKPRQKHARFCLVDFANTEDRDKALKQLKKQDSKLAVSLPKTDDEDFIKTLVDKKIKQSEKKRAKNLLRKQSKKNVKQKTFTSTLMVLNLPSSASTTQIKELFPNAVDIQTKEAAGKHVGKMIATVTLPSTEDAKNNSKRKLVVGGNDLIIRFNTNPKKNFKKNKKAMKNASPSEGSQKGPIAPVNAESPTKSVKTPKKRSISENGSTNVPEKKAKGKKPLPTNKKGNQSPNGKPGGKPKKQNKQKKQPPKKGKAVLASAE